MEVPSTYLCSTCNEVFATKSDRNNHIRRICQSFVTITDLNGAITRIERINGKFECFKCGCHYNRSDSLISHWKKCQMKEQSQSKPYTFVK